MNNVSLLGRLTADPELKYTQGGTAYARFTIAIDRPSNKNQEKVTDFIYCVAFGKLAESIAQYQQKGNQIAVSGSLQMERYQDQNGQSRTSFSVVISKADFIWNGEKQSNQNQGYQGNAQRSSTTAYSDATSEWETLGDEVNLDDMPF